MSNHPRPPDTGSRILQLRPRGLTITQAASYVQYSAVPGSFRIFVQPGSAQTQSSNPAFRGAPSPNGSLLT